MNRIHIAIAAAWVGLATLMVATATNAKDFSVAGQTLSIGAETDLITALGIGLSVATDIDMLELDEGDIFQGLDFTADYTVPSTNINLYTEVSTDADLEFGDVTVGAKVSF